jgi:hypothetical protein
LQAQCRILTSKITEQRQIIVGATGKLGEYKDKVSKIATAGNKLTAKAIISPEDAKAAEELH